MNNGLPAVTSRGIKAGVGAAVGMLVVAPWLAGLGDERWWGLVGVGLLSVIWAYLIIWNRRRSRDIER